MTLLCVVMRETSQAINSNLDSLGSAAKERSCDCFYQPFVAIDWVNVDGMDDKGLDFRINRQYSPHNPS